MVLLIICHHRLMFLRLKEQLPDTDEAVEIVKADPKAAIFVRWFLKL